MEMTAGSSSLGHRVANYFHTIRYLRPGQITSRVWRGLYRPAVDTRPAAPLREHPGKWWMCPGHQPQLLGPKTFSLLNQNLVINKPEDWNSSGQDKLVLYHLHYFGDLVADGFPHRARWHSQLLERWVKENPPSDGNGWESYPLSLRIVNWIKWALAGNELSPDLLRSLATQARYLARRLEFHLLGNHLFANAKALIFAGAFFSGPEADHMLRNGLELAGSEAREQFLADGGHFERSPMYHGLLTEDLLDLFQLGRLYTSSFGGRISDLFKQFNLSGVIRWLEAMSHPDGEIAFFNDATFGVALPVASLQQYASFLGIASQATDKDAFIYLKDSGYVKMRSGDATVIFDAGPLGPDYLLGHAHADTLSFELSLGKKRILVNSGTSTYTGPRRNEQRGTAAHNTVMIDKADSSEVWSSFRVARRARPLNVHVEGNCASAAHDGYRRLPGAPIHHRACMLTKNRLLIQDRIEGSGRHEVTIYFHAAPGLKMERAGDDWQVRDGERALAKFRLPRGTQSHVKDSLYFPGFGIQAPNQTLLATWAGTLAFNGETVIEWGTEL